MTSPSSKASPALLLLSLQFLTRLFTFVLNQVLVRISDPSLYGAAHIHLELLLGLVLFLSREGVRGALIRQSDDTATGKGNSKAHEEQVERAAINLALVPLPLGFLIGGIALPIFLRSSDDALTSQGHYRPVIYLYLLSALLELLAEPIYLHAISHRGGRDLALRVRAEGSAAIAKGLITVAVVAILGSKRGGLLAFGLGQAAYGATVLLSFVLAYISRRGLNGTLRLYVPQVRTLSSTGHSKKVAVATIDQNQATRRLAVSLFFQSVLKHILTEADKVAVSRLASLQDQGGYALGTNYASLPLRLIFQPLEEASRFSFSQWLGGKGSEEDRAPLEPSKTEEGNRGRALRLLKSLLMLHLYLAILLIAYLPPLSAPFIRICSGPQWAATSAPATLRAFAVFLPAAAWSGILEGFLQSTATGQQLQVYNRVILSSSASFGVALWLLTRPQFKAAAQIRTEEALVLASTVSMAVRAAWCWRFSKSVFPSSSISLRKLLPSSTVVLTTVAGGLTTRMISHWSFYRTTTGGVSDVRAYMPLILTAGITGLSSLGSMYLFDRRRILASLAAIQGREGAADEHFPSPAPIRVQSQKRKPRSGDKKDKAEVDGAL